MPGLAYLDANPADAQGFNRLGANFSDALIGMQQQRIMQQRFAQQMMMEQQRLQLAQQAQQDQFKTASMDRDRIGAQIAELKSKTKGSDFETQRSMNQEQSGQELGQIIKGLYETDPQKNPDVNQFLRGLQAQQVAKIAATNPSNIVKQMGMLSQGRDPGVERLMATDTPAVMNVPAGATALDAMTGRPVYQSPPRVSLMDPNRVNMEDLRSLSNLYGHVGQRVEGDQPMSDAVNQRLLQLLSQGRGGSGAPGIGAPSTQGSGRVTMRSKDGKVGTVPAEQVEKAKAAGYTIEN